MRAGGIILLAVLAALLCGLLLHDVGAQPTVSPTVTTGAPTASPTAATDAPTASPTAATDAPTASPTAATDAPTTSPTATATDAPTASPVAGFTDAPTASPVAGSTDAPTASPVVGSTNTPTASPDTATGSPSVLSKCRPVPKANVRQCNKKRAACVSTPMKWTGKGCRDKKTRRILGDGGCQCKGYCGYLCSQACNKDRECFWSGSVCRHRGSGLVGGPIPVCLATTTAPSSSPTVIPS